MEEFNLGKFLADSGVNMDTGNRKRIEDIPIDRIDPDPNNFYNLSNLEDLASNIALMGLQQPILVRPCGDRYTIISGHRRHAAMQKLIDEDGRDDLRKVPCIVDRAQDSPEFTQLKLIYANASTRTMTSAEQSAQTEQVEKLLYQLKEQGMEFPGRMRDYVAQICKISTGKLARLKIIRSKLIPQFMRLWETDELREAVAYTLAGLPPVRQKAIWIAQTKEGKQKFPCTDGWVQNIAREMDKVESVCKSTSCMVNYIGHCDHVHVRLNHAANLSQYSGMNCRSCCCTCTWLLSCRYSCEYAEHDKQLLRSDAKAKKDAEKAEQKAKEAPKRAMLEDVYRRVGELRNAKGITAEEFTRVSQGYLYAAHVEKLPLLEQGQKIQLTDRMPGGIWPDDAQKLIAVADLLGCSIDYLLGRTDCKEVNRGATECVKIDTGWRTGHPDKPGRYCILTVIEDCSDYQPVLDKAEWTGDGWTAYGSRLEDVGMSAAFWIPFPED